MPLSLDQYATEYLPTRGLPWPAMPKVQPAKARPATQVLPVRAVYWTVYGTLLAIPNGEIQYEAQLDFVTDMALEKTIQEFKMWNSMSRKPGAPSAYLKEIFRKAHSTIQLVSGKPGEKHPEMHSEKIWEDIVKKLFLKDYQFDMSLYGDLNEYVKKIAYFYHASIQGTGCYDGAAEALRLVAERGLKQGLLGDGQCFSTAQLAKGLQDQEPGYVMATVLPLALRHISSEVGAKKPSETIFQAAMQPLRAIGITPAEVLHIGSDMDRDLIPAKKLGMRTALFAGDKSSLKATPEQLKDPETRPDALLTELTQISELLA